VLDDVATVMSVSSRISAAVVASVRLTADYLYCLVIPGHEGGYVHLVVRDNGTWNYGDDDVG
jgi:hypothetical protein